MGYDNEPQELDDTKPQYQFLYWDDYDGWYNEDSL